MGLFNSGKEQLPPPRDLRLCFATLQGDESKASTNGLSEPSSEAVSAAALYKMERPSMTPTLLDLAADTYFVSTASR